MTVLYIYAIGDGLSKDLLEKNLEAVDGSSQFAVADADGLSALYTPVDGAQFSQDEIDRHASDMNWLAEIGYRHQNVLASLGRKASAIPLRAFTLFSNVESLRTYLQREKKSLLSILDRIRDKDEWTVRLEFDHEQWSRALVKRVPGLRKLQQESEAAGSGRGYLLRRKLDEERKKAAQTAEEDLLREVEESFAGRLATPVIVENREAREGSFPQINLLIDRSRAHELKNVHQDIAQRYAPDGVRIALTGPWPPYTFATDKTHG